MKKIKNILSKALLLSLILAMCVSMTIGAEDAQWENVFTEDYNERLEIPEDYAVSDTDQAFAAQITDSALETKYTSSVYIEPTGLDNRTVKLTSDSNLIEVFKDGAYKAYLQNTVTDAYTFKVFSETGNNTYFVTDVGEKKAFRIGSHAVSASKFRYNRLWLLADKGQQVFTTNDNNARIVVEYYAVDDTPDNDYGMEQKLTVNYKNSSDSAKSQSITIADSDLNKWNTWDFTLEDVDFTKTTTKDNSPWNINFATPYTAELNDLPTETVFTEKKADPGFEVYIRSVRIMKVDGDTPKFDNTKKTVQIPLGEGGNCGDSKVTFDVAVDAEKYSKDGAYRVSIANENKDELATLQIEDNGDDQSIYTISSDEYGNEIKSDALYTGDIIGKTITYTLEMNFRGKTFTLSASDENGTLVPETESVSINNLDKVSGCAFGDYLVVTHSENSAGTTAVIDNISYDFVEDPAGVKAKADLDAIELAATVEDVFELPEVGSENESTITWESSDPAILSIDGYEATPHCAEEAQEVTLTATATNDGVPCVKTFTITVAEHADHVKLEEEIEALEVASLGATLRAEVDFAVPTQGSDETVSVSWSSSDVDYSDGAAIVVSNGNAAVYRGEFDTVITITATITVGEFPGTKDFEITIPGQDGVKATVGEIEETTSTVDGINYISPAVNVKYPGMEGNLTFAAFSLDANGNIVDRKEDTKEVTEFGTYDFAITDLKTTGSTEVKYYLWDENGVSIINNEPTRVTDLTAAGKAKGVRLNWTASVDDFDAIAYYAVYRDGDTLVGTTTEATYLDEDVVAGENHTYTVVPVDKNNLYPEKSNEGGAASIDMFYLDYSDGTKSGVGTNDISGSSYVVWKTEEIAGYTAAHCVSGKAIGLTVSGIPATDSDVTFEVTYLDNDSALKIDHMTAGLSRTSTAVEGSGGNSGEWKTAVVRVESIAFVKSTVITGSDFNFTGNNSGPYIKSVRLIQTDLYN